MNIFIASAILVIGQWSADPWTNDDVMDAADIMHAETAAEGLYAHTNRVHGDYNCVSISGALKNAEPVCTKHEIYDDWMVTQYADALRKVLISIDRFRFDNID